VFDYVIVGGGSAGCVLAGRLSEDPSVKVCLLEAGPPDTSLLIKVPAGLALMAKNQQSNWSLNTVPQPGLNGRRGYQPRGKVLGGSSSINAMIYARGHRADYDHWAAQGNPGWSWNDVLPRFIRSEHNERGADAFHGVDGPLNVMDLRSPNPFGPIFIEAARQCGFPVNPDFNGAEQEGVGPYQVTHRNGERFNAARAYLDPVRHRPNLSIITGAHVLRVLFEGRRAVGVVCRDAGGGERQIRADREVLLSAGALLTPQLLMLSGIGPGEHLQSLGLPVLFDQPGVGAQLHDHIDVVQVFDAPGHHELFALSMPGLLRATRGIFEWRRDRRGILTTNFAEAGGFIRSRPEEPIPDLQLHFVIGKLVDHGRKTQFGPGFSCHVCLLRPLSRGSVRLASPDPMALPLIDPNFLAERDDMDRMIRGFKLMRGIMNAPALAPYRGRELGSAQAITDAQIETFIRDHADTIYHPVGSCRMGPADTDVVDAHLRVRGVSGLRVVDASIMPRIVGGNTNAPVIMVAERAVDFIREEQAALRVAA